jgi:hypothetical protein
MKTMLWKEFRENLKWGVLAMLALGVAELYALNQRQMFNMSLEDSETLCKSSFLMATTFGCAAVGLVLGLVQILPEQRRDQWAALIHRPVERAVIFRGKAVAGFVLYLLATVPPFLVCVWYVATPGLFGAPFVPRMVYPGVADICAGAVYYFAALFVALRRGPWWGTRVFGLIAALHASFFVAETYHPFFVVVEAAVLMALALFTAAWSAMLTNGTFRGQPWLGRLALLAVVFYGTCTLGELAESLQQSFSRPHYYYGTQYVVDITGRVLKEVYSQEGTPRYYDLAGNPVYDKHLTRNSYSYELGFTGISSYIGESHGAGSMRIFEGYRNARSYLLSTNETPGESWYYVPQERFFTGYKTQSRALIGSIGREGFAAGATTAAGFTQPMRTQQYWQLPEFVQFDETAYYLDFDNREIFPVWAARPGEKIFGVGSLQSYQNDVMVRDLAGVSFLHFAMIVNKSGAPLVFLPYDRDMDRYGMLSVAMMPDRTHFFLRYSPSQWIDYEERAKMPEYLEEMDLHGVVLQTYTLPPEKPQRGHRTWQQYLTESVQSLVYLYGYIAYVKVGAMTGSHRMQRELGEIFGRMWHYEREILVRTTVVSLALAGLTLFWARRRFFSWRRAWAWAAFVLGFNVAGLITFRLCADWPILLPCPACGKKRPIERETCPVCGAAWPAPAREGTEIFDGESGATLAGTRGG